MLDDLRKEADTSLFDEAVEETPTYSPPPSGHFLGMTPFQRFIIAVMLLAIVLLLSASCLLVTEKVVPPFM
jgi:hypothetical protein